MPIYFEKQVQIKIKAQIRALIFNKVFTTVLAKYFNYNNIILVKHVIKL